MRRIFDISMGINNGMLTYPGDPGVELRREHKIEDGASANLSMYCIGSHTGTHMDPPYHFFPGGGKTETIPLDALIGKAVVVDAPVDEIDRGFLIKAGLEKPERVLFKTRNSAFSQDPEFRQDFAHLTPDGAEYLAGLGVKLVGIDYLSIEKYHSPDHAVHKLFLKAGVVIVEGLDLSGVELGEYTLMCLPLKIIGGDGAPCRAVLIESNIQRINKIIKKFIPKNHKIAGLMYAGIAQIIVGVGAPIFFKDILGKIWIGLGIFVLLLSMILNLFWKKGNNNIYAR